MRHLLKILPVLVLILIAAGALLLVRQRRAELDNMETAASPSLPVVVAEARQGKIKTAKHYLGFIEPEDSAVLAARITGHLRAVRIDTGDRVEKNDIVVLIDDRELKKKLSALQAELEGAEAELADRKQRHERRMQLFEKGHVNKEDLDASKSALVSARSGVNRLLSEIRAAEISLLYTRLKTPFDGIVTERMKNAGDLVMPGEPVCRIENPEAGYKILVKIDTQTARKLGPGTPARLTDSGKTTDAEIFRIHPAADKNRLSTAEIRTKKPPFSLPSGAVLGVDILISTPEALVLPRRAAVEINGKWRVFIADADNRIKPAEVSVLGRTGEQIAVKSDDLKPGDRVAVGDESLLIRLGTHTRIQPLSETRAAAGEK